MLSLRALLFDLDGTLADTAAANYEAYAAALAEVGVGIEREAFERIAFGRNWRQFLPQLLEGAGVSADAAGVADRKHQLYGGMAQNVRVNHGLVALASACRPTLYSGLVTTASRAAVTVILEQHNLTNVFDVVVTGDDVARHKPDPEAYLQAASRLTLAPSACIAFEDSDIGVASACAAGMAVVRVAF